MKAQYNAYARKGQEALYANPWPSEPGEGPFGLATRVFAELVSPGDADDEVRNWVVDVYDTSNGEKVGSAELCMRDKPKKRGSIFSRLWNLFESNE